MSKFPPELKALGVYNPYKWQKKQKSNYAKEIEKITKKALNELNEKEKRKIFMDSIILPNKYLREADFPGFSDINDKIIEAKNEDTNFIYWKAKELKIVSGNIDSDDWDDFFKDLRNKVKSKDIEDFDKKIIEFENTSYYKAPFFNIQKMWDELDEQLKKIYSSKDGKSFVVKLLWKSFEYANGTPEENKKEALLVIYKMKLILKELEEARIMMIFAWLSWIGITWYWITKLTKFILSLI